MEPLPELWCVIISECHYKFSAISECHYNYRFLIECNSVTSAGPHHLSLRRSALVIACSIWFVRKIAYNIKLQDGGIIR